MSNRDRLVIYKNPEILRGKLPNLEPIATHRRIGNRTTVVFGVNDSLIFDPKLRILTNRDCKLLKEQGRLVCETKVKEPTPPIRIPQQGESSRVCGLKVKKQKIDTQSNYGDRLQSEDPGGIIDEREPEDEGSFVDKLILDGPEEDEFRQYDDDEPENESIISKNLKKIKSALPTPIQLAKPPAIPISIPRPVNPQASETSAISKPLVKEATPPDKVEMEPQEIISLLEKGNLRLFHSEMSRRVATLKSNELLRSSLKRAVLMCLDKDETFALLDFVELVTAYNYLEDMQFWDEFIKKVRRKDNPYAKCHNFKCKANPELVIRNYQLVIQKVDDFFNQANAKITLDWHSCRYVMNTAAKMRKPIHFNSEILNPGISSGTNSNASSTSGQQENVDPKVNRVVYQYKDKDGERKFQIRAPRREVKEFSRRLLI